MKKRRFLRLIFGASLTLFLLTAVSSQTASSLPRSLSSSRLAAPPDYRTIELMHYRTIELLHYQTNPTPTPLFNPTATPSTQGGHGKDIFFVYCMPCHGDQGQGLTDEFRNRQYPPEDVNCWESGCHGARPYENGFTLPKTVPVLIGAGALQRFNTAQNMYAFMRASMPFNAPGSLSDEQYLELTAFLLEQNQFTAQGARLDAAALQHIALQPTPAPTPAAAQPAAAANDRSSFLLPGLIALLGLTVLLVLVMRSRSGRSFH
jgi:mono/diheme cytochrome c family protein